MLRTLLKEVMTVLDIIAREAERLSRNSLYCISNFYVSLNLF